MNRNPQRGWVIMDTQKGPTYGHVVVALGRDLTRLAAPNWFGDNFNRPCTWSTKSGAELIRGFRLGNPRRYQARRVTATLDVS